MCTAEEYSELVPVAPAGDYSLTINLASVTTWTDRGTAERDSLATRIRELEDAKSTSNGELALFGGLCGRKCFVPAGEDRENTVKVLTRQTLDKTSELRAFVKRMN